MYFTRNSSPAADPLNDSFERKIVHFKQLPCLCRPSNSPQISSKSTCIYPATLIKPSSYDIMSTRRTASARPSAPTLPPFLQLPLEIRLRIYDLGISRKCCREYLRTGSCDCTGWDIITWTRCEHYGLLLANRQIFLEAAKIFYASQFEQINRVSQTYNIYQTRARVKTESPTWLWEIGSDHVWQPVCRDVKEFAQLRLPKLELKIWQPGNDRIKEVLHALEVFLKKLATELLEENTTHTLEIDLPDMDCVHWKLLFHALNPLTRMNSRCSITIAALNFQMLDYFVAQFLRAKPILRLFFAHIMDIWVSERQNGLLNGDAELMKWVWLRPKIYWTREYFDTHVGD